MSEETEETTCDHVVGLMYLVGLLPVCPKCGEEI
jgi:hypothetical protein